MIKMFIESFKNMFQKPDTIKYPFEPSPPPKGRYRGTILYEESLCIFCDKCENVCPPGAILFEIVDYETNKREYNYNPYLCIYCGACVDECPKADEGCLVQDDTTTPVLGRELPKDKKLGYLVNRVENPKELEKAWDELEKRAKKSREEYAEFKKQQRLKKQREKKAAEAKKKAEEQKENTSSPNTENKPS